MDHKPTQAISKSKFVAGCLSLKGVLRKYSAVSGICSPSSETPVPPSVRWVVLAEGSAARVCFRDELRRNGGSEWAGCGAGLGIAGARNRRSGRARKDSEGSGGILWAGHAGAGHIAAKAPADVLMSTLACRGRIPHLATGRAISCTSSRW